jgi:hypothetical protein
LADYGQFDFMSKLQTPKHKGTRSFLRVAGLLVAAVGLVFLIIGMASFFSAFGGGGPPRLFWCCFVGMPLLFVGDLAEGTQGAVKTVARAVAEGVREAQSDKK